MLIALAIGGAACGLLTHNLMPQGVNVGFVGVLEAVRLRNGTVPSLQRACSTLRPTGTLVRTAPLMQLLHCDAAGIISFTEGLGVALISATSIGVGASVGRYGPAVHIGAAIGSLVGEQLELNRESVVTLLAAGLLINAIYAILTLIRAILC